MADIRINALATTAASTASDDFIAVDGSANGTRKLNAYSPTFGGNLTVQGTGASSFSGPVTFASGGDNIKLTRTSFSSWQFGIGSVNSINGLHITDTTGNTTPISIAQGAPDASLKIAATTGNATLTGNLTVSGTGTSSFAGSLGIGTTSPTRPLDVRGSLGMQVNEDNAGTKVISIRSDFAGAGPAINVTTNDPLLFLTNNSERARITSGGNLLIGTTTDGGQKLQVNGTAAITGQIRGANIVASNLGTADTGFYGTAGADAGSAHRLALVRTDSPTGGSALLSAFGAAVVEVNATTGLNTGTRALTIDTSANATFAGSVFVGTSSNNGRLCVQGADTGSTNAFYVTNSTPAIAFRIQNDGYITTGALTNSPYNNTTGSAANLFVDSGGGLARSTSSIKYKKDVQDAVHGLADVLKLRPVTYRGKNDGNTVFGGLIAEEVHAAGLTEFVQYAPDGSPDALAYGNMVSVLVNAIKELNNRLVALENA